MLSTGDSSYGTTESIIRAARAASRREILRSKRPIPGARTTDILPDILSEDEARGKTGGGAKSSRLHEENQQLRRELASLQTQLEEYRVNMDLLDREIATIHQANQREIQQLHLHLQEALEERNRMFEDKHQLEQQYQELYASFQQTVEEEAQRLVKQAAQTLELSPEDAPPLLGDVVKTLESQVRSSEDQRIAEMLTIVRQAQYKSELLAQELESERSTLAEERARLHLLQASIGDIAQERYTLERNRLRSRWAVGVTLIAVILLALMVGLVFLFSGLHLPMTSALFAAMGICMILSYGLARFYASGKVNVQIDTTMPQKKAKAAKAAKK